MAVLNPSDIIHVEKELDMPREELLAIIADYRKREREERAFRIENQNALTVMAKDYQALKAKLEAVVLERDRLKKDLAYYEDFKGFVTCDAYCSYKVIGKENQDAVFIRGCLMHIRRRYVQSLSLVDKSKMSDAEILELSETKALMLINRIYDADEALKSLSEEKRLAKRKEVVSPLVDEFFEFVDGIDTSDPLISNRLLDAVNYSKNQKDFLSVFLKDGNVPIDNGASERHIRAVAIGRKNFLFCGSLDGAEALAIMYTIVETAKSNNANVYFYLRYILEQMPRYMEGTDTGFLERMTPWSPEYMEYERCIRP